MILILWVISLKVCTRFWRLRVSSTNYPLEEDLSPFKCLCMHQISFPPFLEGHISGYERYICRRCLGISPLSFIVIKDTGELIRTEHRCHPVTIARVQNLTEDEKNCMFLHHNKSSNDTMQNAIKDWWIGGKSPYLIVKKLQSVPRNSYDFTSELKQGWEW